MIDKLEMFIAVAREGHFGRAAESLNISQPSLSAGIKQLEEQLGVQLVFRGSRYGGLTPEGQSALVWAQRIVGDARQFREEMRVKRNGLSGELRLATIPTALTWAALLSADFTKRNPKVRFTILSRTSREILALLDRFEIDAGISYLDNEPLGRVHTAPLYDEDYMLVCATGSDFANRASVPWADLSGQTLALLTPDMQNRRIISQIFAAHNVTPTTCIESNSTIVLVASVEAGRCMTVLPRDIAQFLASGRNVTLVPLTGAHPRHSVGLIVPHREPRSPVIDALLIGADRLFQQSRSEIPIT
ncbi:DNA-binding transcriptional regulator, LysR family [Pseudorhodobacter antarcticus]|jgi:DNA-binding transcriptional LysR family regulator|uniref:DNA-binding transcriptional regulator, LysR family n=1 Tax=Pseudorhodobacter antarcticus TaxID=1077947 RepID=A0A1H8GXL5_9RHOB|nr:LysR family transcriptional regulator [Pseudorhodobacter antarcticus]SEN48474.1 DNA-binding transcriptional regulator, LysR family [Pseudorhodobacter antarcticus]